MQTFDMDSLGRIITDLSQFDPAPVHDGNGFSAVTRRATLRLIERLECLLFPIQHAWSDAVEGSRRNARLELLGVVTWDLAHQIHRASPHHCEEAEASCPRLTDAFETALGFVGDLPKILYGLTLDLDAAFKGDPAARDRSEIISSYPGLYAIMVYRLAHRLWEYQVPLLPRLMTEIAHSETGIDIHPGARIGSSFFIDHGTGVVIGETTEVGDQVTLYQGVTLGALNFPRDAAGNIIRGQKRHPTIGDRVVIYSGATILGGSTVIGEGSVIGGNVWLTESVPAFSRVIAQPKIQLKSTNPEGGTMTVGKDSHG